MLCILKEKKRTQTHWCALSLLVWPLQWFFSSQNLLNPGFLDHWDGRDPLPSLPEASLPTPQVYEPNLASALQPLLPHLHLLGPRSMIDCAAEKSPNVLIYGVSFRTRQS